MSPFQKKLLVMLLVLAVLTPLGLYLPAAFNAGDAWGEWSTETVKRLIGYVPEKMKGMADLWKAPISDYNLGDESSSFMTRAASYILSGVIGVALCGLALFGLSRLLVKKKDDRRP